MKVEIDPTAGFCKGVLNAINLAEENLSEGNSIYSLGEIIHNREEIKRLKDLGLKEIDNKTFGQLNNATILIRTHGEPPETYKIAHDNNLKLIDATCPVVLNLQKKVRRSFNKMDKKGGQVVIVGKQGHAEVRGLTGQANNQAIIIDKEEDLKKIDYSKPIAVYAQTTIQPARFKKLIHEIRTRASAAKGLDPPEIIVNDSICRQVSGREEWIREFAAGHDVIIFVSDPKSANGRRLYEMALSVNPRTHAISSAANLNRSWFNENDFVGISGATSTPPWLLDKILHKIKGFNNKNS